MVKDLEDGITTLSMTLYFDTILPYTTTEER
jgi:hypothetical protein